MSDSWAYDVETSNWEWFSTRPTQPGWTPPVLHSAASCLLDHRLFIFGGITQKGQHLRGLMELNLETGDWKGAEDSTGPSARWGATLVPYGSSLFLFGGFGDAFYNDLWRYDLEEAKWTALGPAGLPPPRHYHTAAVYGLKMYIFGGFRGSAFTADIWAYEFEANRWIRIDGQSAVSQRRGHSCTVLPHRKSCVIMGGRDDKKRLNDVIEFRFEDHSFETLRPAGSGIPMSRVFHSSFYYNHSLFFFGGLNTYNTNEMLEYVLEPRPSGSITGHSKPTSIDFTPLLFSSSLSDITFRIIYSVNGEKATEDVPAHKAILYAASAHFKRMFDAAMVEASANVIEIHDATPEAFKEVIHFMYTGRCRRLTTHNVTDILVIADKFLLYDLVRLIELALSLIITQDNILHILELPTTVPSATTIASHCIAFLATAPLQPAFKKCMKLIKTSHPDDYTRLNALHDTEKAKMEQRKRLAEARAAQILPPPPASATASSSALSQSAPISAATMSPRN